MANVYVTSAFSKDGSGGNKAGIVLQEEYLSKTAKMELAKKLGYSETAFLSCSDTADCKVEYFTPVEEVPLCGHATIAAFVTLKSLNLLSRTKYTIETKSGILEISIDRDGMVLMEQNNPIFYDTLERQTLKKCFNIEFIDEKLPIQIVSTGLRDILVPVDKPEHLKGLIPNFKAISDISRKRNIVGIHAFSLVNQHGLTAVCRNFAPLYGIHEESATGTSNCALAGYLFRHGQKQKQYIFDQGHNLDHISRIIVNTESREDSIVKIAAGGYGYLVCRKNI